jgi:hypothetical protein
MSLFTGVTKTMAQDERMGYGLIDNETFGKGIYTFSLADSLSNLKLYQSLNVERISGGYMLDNKYYYLEYTQNAKGYTVDGFYYYDMDNKTAKQIANYGSVQQGTICSSFAYDYQSKTMFALNSFNGGNALSKINLDNGDITEVVPLKIVGQTAISKTYPDVADQIMAITCDYDGNMYGISYWAGLFRINKATGECDLIADLDYNPDKAYMYTGNSLFYDNNTDELYFRIYTYYGMKDELVKIDKKTGHVTHVAKLPDNCNLLTSQIPFTVAEASAPAKVENLKITRGDNGGLTATLDWDNPSKTYGRGGTLEDLDSVIIYRDGVEMNRIATNAIGGHMTWTDKLAERGYYTYKVVPVNTIGHGDRVSVGAYIGAGDPLPVSDITVTPYGSKAMISWSAPTKGKFDSWIDTSTLTYDIIRLKDNHSVSKNIKYTSIMDNEISEIGKYAYEIIAHTNNAISDTAVSDYLVLGPPVEIPHKYTFATQDEFDVWTTIDANGNGYTWNWASTYSGKGIGVKISYPYDEIAAADWLISPYMAFKAGKHYKMTFDATPASKKVLESIAVSMGQGNTIAAQDSVYQFNFRHDGVTNLRANLPVVAQDGNYNVGFLYRTAYANYGMTLNNVEISEDHEGYIAGKVTCGGKPVADAMLLINGGQFTSTTDKDGNYKLSYLPSGDYDISVTALGYEDKTVKANVKELETTTLDVDMTALPEYSVSGKVVDVANDAVAGAQVDISGYNTYSTTTDANGNFTVTGVYKNSNYGIVISKNKLLSDTKNFVADADVDLGTITLKDNIKAPGKVSIEAGDTAKTAKVSWKAPVNDPQVMRIDDGTLTTTVGLNSGTSNSVFGVVRREPSLVTGVQFYLDGTATVKHYSVNLFVFNLDANGEPTDSILYSNTYVPVTDGQWNTYTLPTPTDAPNGYFMAIASYNYLGIGIDGAGDSSKYPFVANTNCFSSDYTTGKFHYLDAQSTESFHHNFLMRPVASLYEVDEDKASAPRFIRTNNMEEGVSLDCDKDIKAVKEDDMKMDKEPMKSVQSRVRYNVYRMKSADMSNETNWTLMSEKQQERTFSDSNWGSLEQGAYAYAVKAVYTGDLPSVATLSDSIGNKMRTTVKVHLNTNTPENESFGAKVQIVNGGGIHAYQTTADENGNVTLPNVWKGVYDMTISLDGFNSLYNKLTVDKNSEYSFDYKLIENQVKPFNLIIEDCDAGDSKTFIWNYPDAFKDDFEGHEDFAVNSPGEIGWQYIDGDGAETGGMTSYTWTNEFKPMAFMIFNPHTTDPVLYGDDYTLVPRSGNKMLADFAAYGVPNDDWIITPRLHFQKDFKLKFYAKSMAYGYPEAFEVAYSTTDMKPQSFINVQDSTTAQTYYMPYSYDIPKEAKYVGIHSISDQKRVFMIDDIQFGLESAMNAAPYYISNQTAASAPRRAPSLDGAYEVYLDGKKVANTDDKSYVFRGLTVGKHTAGVIASYTSGKTEMSTIDFEITATGITSNVNNGLKITVEGRKLTIDGAYKRAELIGTNGAIQSLRQISSGVYSLNNISNGVYFVNVYTDKEVKTMKFIIK